MEYADLLAKLVTESLTNALRDGIAFFGVKSKLDLHPEHGYLLSTNKFIDCRDNKGNRYRITVEANPELSMDGKLAEANKKHSRNGDFANYCIESVATKLSFALQDSTVLAEIDEAELEVLLAEVKAAKEAKKTRGEILNVNF